MDTYNIQPGLQSAPAEPRKWYQIWWEVWRYPGADTFRSILTEPNATMGRGSLWILLTALASAVITTLINLVFLNNRESAPVALASGLICAPIGAVIGAFISTAIYHATSRLFGSSGKYEQLFFCLSAIQAPETVFGMIVYVFYPFFFAAAASGSVLAVGIPLLCLVGVGLLLGLYSLVLFVLAVEGAENISTGKAVGAVLLPTLVVIALGACAAAALVNAVARSFQ